MSNLLPNDIVTNILSRLPVKSVLRFRCVCKFWYSLINNPYFIKMHLNQTIENNNNTILLRTHQSKLYSIELDDNDQAIEIDYPTIEIKDYPDKAIYDTRSCFNVAGSCNGLLCIWNIDRDVFIWNPSTKEFKILPQTPNKLVQDYRDYSLEWDSYYGFGYDSNLDDYKVVKISQYYDNRAIEYFKSEVNVYTLRSNSWRRVDNMSIRIDSEDQVVPVYVNGNINWRGEDDMYGFPGVIVSFDLVHEIWRQHPQPEFKEKVIQLGVLGKNLCLLTDNSNQSDVWVMKDFGVKESWCKLFTIPKLMGMDPFFLEVVCFSKSGELLLNYRNRVLLLYNTKLEKTETLHIQGTPDSFMPITYEGSLVSLHSSTDVGNKKRKRQEFEVVYGLT
ncbi:hypothetical protein AQUCO_04900096v1 [Aquilegia coerulea]|uniref:F-box domain-containing protein n=1 Tax=Aquilegia coerulea TaxID=218851 RepID=A0A2G5CL36_AQUCA|nr:hypothetical protein AQUCO_04900096v1 [Aquilegia coerulea]PIA31557.1 hypothetical protein AQUCO_04900096v1 [Aquilegia coerulea]